MKKLRELKSKRRDSIKKSKLVKEKITLLNNILPIEVTITKPQNLYMDKDIINKVNKFKNDKRRN